jgi:signal transduction histidine kinase
MRLDVGEVLDDITLRFADRARQCGVLLTCAQPAQGAPLPVAEVDIELFERAVANLLDNALKHTPAAGRVTLAAAVVAGEVQVTVTDSGSGIPQADLPQLFDRFYQSRSSVAPAGSEGGRGLGLAIVQRIAELHGGRVAVHSAPGQGTEVLLTLPLAV